MDFARIARAQGDMVRQMQARAVAQALPVRVQLPEFEQCEQDLSTYRQLYQNLVNEMRTNTPRDVHDTITALEFALTTLFKLAIFIRGDYDSRDEDEAQKSSLLKLAVDAFKTVKVRAEAAYNGVARLHSTNVELRSTKIAPLDEKIEALIRKTDIELQSLESQIAAQTQQISTLQTTYRQTEQSLSSLQSKLKNAKKDREVVRGVFAAISFGITEIPGVGAPDIGGMQNSINSLNNTIKDIQNNLNTQQIRLMETTQKQMQLNNTKLRQQTLKTRLPGLNRDTDGLLETMDDMQRNLLKLKNVADELFTKVGNISSKAEVTAELSYLKKEFASGILDVCDAALIDIRTQDEVKMIFDEVVNEYWPREKAGKPLPDVVQEIASQVRSGLETIGLEKSLEDAAGGHQH